jgi:hypothetical protein
MRRAGALAGFAICLGASPARLEAEDRPSAELFQVLDRLPDPGPRVTPFLRHQLDRAWRQDEERRAAFAAVRSEADLARLKRKMRDDLLEIVGGLPQTRTPLEARVVGTLPRDGYRIEKVVFESLPGLHVTALLYLPEAPAGRKPAVLLACGHAPLGKAHPAYQEMAARLAKRGYVVLCFDPVGQGERSQFWDAARGRSRYNLVCGEHAVLGNLCTLAGTSLVRFMVWDAVRALDYLESRPEVDGQRLAVTGTSGGGFQSTWLGALDERVGVVLPSCFPTALPMRMANRIFEDPDSDPEQDPPGLVSRGVDHAGLLLLVHPRPLHVSAAVLDFFPIEGTRKALREVRALYERFGQGDRIALAEGFHKHEHSAENQAAAFAFLDRSFGRPVKPGLDPVTTLEPEALRCTPSGQVREWRLTRFDGVPVRQGIAWEEKGRGGLGAAVIERYLLHHQGGLAIPLVHIHARGGPKRRTILRVGLEGKLGPRDWSEVAADLARGDAVVSFDLRGLGETRMRYKAASIDDPDLAPLDEAAAYSSPLSGVLANHVYNSLLAGRPYFLEMIEDAEIASRFARGVLGARRLAVAGHGEAHTYAAAIAAVVAEVELVPPGAGEPPFSWSTTVEDMREIWPIHYLLSGGAYLRMTR